MEVGNKNPQKSPKKSKHKSQKRKKRLFTETSSDDDFVGPQEGSSKSGHRMNPILNAEEIRKQNLKERVAKSRAKKSNEQIQLEREKNAQRMATKRANQTNEERQVERENAKQGMAKNRAKKTPQQREIEKDNARQRMAQHRLPTLTGVSLKDGLRCQELFQGSFKVAALEDTPDAIGQMSIICQHCGAKKFSRETSSSCCNAGKVVLTPFPRPPEELMKLWIDYDAKNTLAFDDPN